MMKTTLISVLALSYCTAVAQSVNLPQFDQKIDVPALSLSESLKQNLPPLGEQLPKVGAQSVAPTRGAESPRIVSHMPVMIPNSEHDRNMPIVRPDHSVEHKLIIRVPHLESKGEERLSDVNERLANARRKREAAVKQLQDENR